MGKRGCLTNDYSSLDMDLKARYISTEELMYALSIKMSVALESHKRPCPPWWDRSCDLGLLMGTFLHGLGNYEAMRNDDELPFSNKIKSYVMCNDSEAEAYRHFEVASDAAKYVFDSALVTMKAKFKEQTHAAVAAVFAATKNAGEKDDVKSTYLAKAQTMNDDDIVSLARLKEATVTAFRKPFDLSSKAGKDSSPKYSLPLPDSKHLDYLLVHIVQNIESNSLPPKPSKSHNQESLNAATSKDLPEQGKNTKGNAISTNREILHKAKSLNTDRKDFGRTQLLFAGSLSGADKKTQDDYFLGAASQELASIAVGADSSRYQRGPYVPLIVTRFALGAILQAEESVIDGLVGNESAKNGSSQDDQKSNSSSVVNESGEGAQPKSAATDEVQSAENQQEEKQPANNEPIWRFIKDNATLRASLCTAMLQGGYPSSSLNGTFINISAELRLELNRNPALLPPIPFSCLSSPTPMNKCPFFSMEDAFSPLFKSAGVDWSAKKEALDEYFQSVLLPHCLKLCLTLAGEQTKVVSDEGKNDVYLGRPLYENLSPLPDPFIPIEDHAEEAMTHAYAILRRTRLMKAIRFIVGGGVPLKVLTEFLRGPVWRSQAMGIPVWWCPWIHDLGLLVHAALYGLGSITTVLPLQQSFIEQHVRENFIDGTDDKEPALPKCFLDQASKEEVDAWVDMHSKQFPTLHVVEHRLTLICSHLTLSTDAQYDNVPMFDEGGWPMVEDVTAPGFLADMRTSGTRCLLSDYERLNGA